MTYFTQVYHTTSKERIWRLITDTTMLFSISSRNFLVVSSICNSKQQYPETGTNLPCFVNNIFAYHSFLLNLMQKKIPKVVFNRHLFNIRSPVLRKKDKWICISKHKIYLFSKRKLYYHLNGNDMIKNCQQHLQHYQKTGIRIEWDDTINFTQL